MFPSCLSRISRCVLIGMMFFIAQAFVLGDDSLSKPPPSTQPAVGTPSASYRIKSVTIPPDSAQRKNPKLSQPPTLYVIVKKDGEQIGQSSDSVTGWEVEFPKHECDYYWIDGDDSTSYSVEVWDHFDIETDSMVTSVIHLKKKDFAAPILEHLAKLDPPERAICIEFEFNK